MNFDEMVQGSDTTSAPQKRGLELRRRPDVAVGGLPMVSLLPRELRAAARDKAIRRLFIGGVVLALVVAGGTVAGATALANSAQSRLASENSVTQTLLGQLAKFKDVQTLQQQIALGSAAADVGGSAEVDWQSQIDAVKADMPANYSVTTITADSATPIADYPQGTSPLEMPRVATMQMVIKAPSITQLPIWLRKLRSVPAYADASATVAADDTAGYSVQLTLHLSPKALVNAKKAAQ